MGACPGHYVTMMLIDKKIYTTVSTREHHVNRLYTIGGLDYLTDRFSFKNARRCSIMLLKVPLWLISMLGNTIFEAYSLADCSVSVTTFTMLCSGVQSDTGTKIGGGGGRLMTGYSTTIDGMHVTCASSSDCHNKKTCRRCLATEYPWPSSYHSGNYIVCSYPYLSRPRLQWIGGQCLGL